MTRRKALLTVGGGIGVVASGYAWSERRGLTREDLVSEPAPSLSSQMNSLLTYAALAPSGHNAQPWSVRVAADSVRIGSDQSRWLSKVDPHNREMALSIGAFLENLLIACPGHGYQADFAITGSNPSDGDLIQVRLAKTTETARNALEPLRLRRTVRTGQLSRPLSGEDVDPLTHYFEQHAHYFPRESREGRFLAQGTIEANRAQARRDDAQAELAEWIRFSNADARTRRDGLTQESMEIAGFAGWYVRHFMGSQSVMSRTFRDQGVDRVQQQVASCGGWILVTSPDSSLESLVETGRKTERMWLSARDRQVAIHPMTQLLEESPFRDQIGKELGIASPIQFVLRVGYVENYPKPVSLRRLVSSILRT